MINRIPSVLLVTLDSCRWDTFQLGVSRDLESFAVFRQAFCHGTYTLPSHISAFSAILPDTVEPLPYYNRFAKSVFRLSTREANAQSLFQFCEEDQSIIRAFNRLGHRTIGVGAVRWFRSPVLTHDFSEFHFTGIHMERQMEILEDACLTDDRSAFLFLNVGETHEPYEFGGAIEETMISRARMRERFAGGFRQCDFDKQVAAVRYATKRLAVFLELLSGSGKPYVVAVTSDHGECFGEDSMYGHGFFHPKVMAVPLGIFGVNYDLP